MRSRSRRRRWPLGPGLLALALILAGTLAACGGRNDDGTPEPPPPPPDLTGVRVMLFPVRAPAPGQLDAELAFWLTDRSPTTDWVPPDTLQAAADRDPSWRMRLETLQRPIADMGRGDLRVRDPLYGALRRLGAVVDSDYAVVPLGAVEAPDSLGTAMALGLAVVDIRGGRVIWRHTVRGEGNPTRAGAVAAVAEKAARVLFP